MRGDSLGLLSADFLIRESNKIPGGSAIQLVAQDPTRWGLIFCSANSGQNAWVSTLPTVTTNQGIILATGFPVLSFNFRDYGALVSGPWFGFAAIGNTIQVVEVLYRPAGLLTTGEEDLEMVEATLRKWGHSDYRR